MDLFATVQNVGWARNAKNLMIYANFILVKTTAPVVHHQIKENTHVSVCPDLMETIAKLILTTVAEIRYVGFKILLL